MVGVLKKRWVSAVIGVFLSGCALANNLANADSQAPPPDYQLVLAGGALAVCSSYSARHCIDKIPVGKSQNQYAISASALGFIQQKSNSKGMLALTNTLSSSISKQPLTKAELEDIFAQAGHHQTVRELSDHDYYLLYDQLEIFSKSANGTTRLTESSNLAASTSDASKAIITTFIEQAKRNAKKERTSPKILVVTASSRDSYAAVDYYQSLFASSGVVTQWLPIDRVLQAVTEAKQCEELAAFQAKHHIFNRQQVYPDLFAQQLNACQNPDQLIAQVNQAHGIFFNGGDQSLTRAALFNSQGTPNAILDALITRTAAGFMVVGGTSAGTAVQAGRLFNGSNIPMISNGRSENAIIRGVFAQRAPSQRCSDSCSETALQPGDVTYQQEGGTGLLPFASTDTHFSERNREGRFIALNALTDTPFGFGVDENTALLVSMDNWRKPQDVTFKAIGAHGVFIYDDSASQVSRDTSGHTFGGYVHFLPHGATAMLSMKEQQWIFEAQHDNSRSPLTYATTDGLWRHYAQQLCKLENKFAQAWALDNINYVIAPLPQTQFWVGENGLCGYAYLGYAISP